MMTTASSVRNIGAFNARIAFATIDCGFNRPAMTSTSG